MEGDEADSHDPELRLAIRAWNLLANGMGGFDVGGVPVVAAALGFEDIDRLLHLLLVIKGHDPEKKDD